MIPRLPWHVHVGTDENAVIMRWNILGSLVSTRFFCIDYHEPANETHSISTLPCPFLSPLFFLVVHVQKFISGIFCDELV
jgi:hypothetical protein